jgi:hypothetical protein
MHLVADIGERRADSAEREPGFTKGTNKNWLDGIFPSSQFLFSGYDFRKVIRFDATIWTGL